MPADRIDLVAVIDSGMISYARLNMVRLNASPGLRLRRAARIGLMLCLGTTGLVAQERDDFSGLWILDDQYRTMDVYGEVRFIRQSGDRIELTILDFSERLAILPWTFRFDRWGPRRGPEDSKQPKTLARTSGDQLVLAKSTASGNGNFVWVWGTGNGMLTHRETRRSWNSDFSSRAPEGREIRFRDAILPESGLEAARVRSGPRSTGEETEFIVRLTEDGDSLLVECPDEDCRVVRLENGYRTGTSALARGEVVEIPVGSEAIVEAAVR